MPVEQAGIYRVRAGDLETVATMGAINPREFADPRATPAVLKQLTDASHGSDRWLINGLPDIRMIEKPTRVAARDAAGSGWIARKSVGKGQCGSVRVGLCGGGFSKKKQKN